jgi:hypothetical protein
MPGTPVAVATVLNSEVVGRSDGRVAIVLVTKELGPVGFEVDQRIVGALRRDLIAAERLLRQQSGKCIVVEDETLSRVRRFCDPSCWRPGGVWPRLADGEAR